MNPPTELIDDLRIIEPPQSWLAQYGWVFALLALLIAGWWLICRRRAQRAAAAAADSAQQAQEDALAELERLFALIDQERSRPYAIESSAIIRRYLERRFELAAPQRSTEEFLAEARHSPLLAPAYQTLLAEFLQCCDLMKFARTFAKREELVFLQDAAIRFVRETAPRPSETAP